MFFDASIKGEEVQQCRRPVSIQECQAAFESKPFFEETWTDKLPCRAPITSADCRTIDPALDFYDGAKQQCVVNPNKAKSKIYAGVGVAIAIVLIAVCVGIYLCYRRNQKSKKELEAA